MNNDFQTSSASHEFTTVHGCTNWLRHSEYDSEILRHGVSSGTSSSEPLFTTYRLHMLTSLSQWAVCCSINFLLSRLFFSFLFFFFFSFSSVSSYCRASEYVEPAATRRCTMKLQYSWECVSCSCQSKIYGKFYNGGRSVGTHDWDGHMQTRQYRKSKIVR